MSAYGISLLTTMGLGIFAWSYFFEGVGRIRQGVRPELILAGVFILISTWLYADMLITYAPEGRGWQMIAFLTMTIQVGTIAAGGIFWNLVGPGIARRFLDAPVILLGLSLVSVVTAVFMSIYFPVSPL